MTMTTCLICDEDINLEFAQPRLCEECRTDDDECRNCGEARAAYDGLCGDCSDAAGLAAAFERVPEEELFRWLRGLGIEPSGAAA